MEVIAHRGWSSRYPENSEIAISEALKLPIQMVEIDVHLSLDDKIIVAHDYSLSRFGDSRLIRDCSYDSLKSIDIGTWFDAKFHNQRFCTLEQVLELINRRCILLIEIKGNEALYPNLSKKIWRFLKQQNFVDDVIIQSFNDYHLKQMKEASNGALKIFKLVEGFSEQYYYDDNWQKGSIVKYKGYDAICPNIKVSNKESVSFIKSVAGNCYSWTVNTIEDLKMAKSFGISGVITDYPLRAIELFQEKS